ncbi:Alcohol dehydrogenase GroES-like domain protein [Aspergillus sclerotialis]|uniref:Alcohol dehydrogenase GroES-like domain protein n=1 Tax=Aspergillus sclerotialis TaxID=2070753 RepID=A0A3A3A1T3_9EURO|nr:Alcohol dehydrogenase GroES-like domain protein [Aspergillus sclerotialis]
MSLVNTTIQNETMRAVVWQGNPYSVGVVDLPKPTIINQTDAIVQMSRAAICGSDLHVYRGTNQGEPAPYGLGHEGVGYITEVGSGVNHLSVGDPVIVPFTVDEGHLLTGLTTQMYAGYGNGGDLGGTQAEYLRVPFADNGLIPVPSLNYTNSTTNESVSLINDYVMLSDIFGTGWTSLDYAGFEAGDTVAVFGAGPVGLMAAYSAILRGASTVYSVDYVPERLRLAESIGSIPINFRDADPVDQILKHEPNGVARSVDAVGYEQVNRNLTVQSDVIIRNMLAVTSTGGGMGTVGVYNPESNNTETAPRAASVNVHFNFSLSDFFFGEFTWGAGPSKPVGLAPDLVHLVASGKARPGFIVSDVINIEDAPEAYARFERHNATKVVIAFD